MESLCKSKIMLIPSEQIKGTLQSICNRKELKCVLLLYIHNLSCRRKPIKSRPSCVLGFWMNGPHSKYQYSSMAPRLSGQNCKFSSFFCPSIPKRDLATKKTTPNIEVWPESLRAMLEYWYIERGLLYFCSTKESMSLNNNLRLLTKICAHL